MSTYVGTYRVGIMIGNLVQVDIFNKYCEPPRVFKSVEMLPTWMQEAMALLLVMNTKGDWETFSIDGVGSIDAGMGWYWLNAPTAGGELGCVIT